MTSEERRRVKAEVDRRVRARIARSPATAQRRKEEAEPVEVPGGWMPVCSTRLEVGRSTPIRAVPWMGEGPYS